MKHLLQDGPFKLLEQTTINERTLVSWYNEKHQDISIALFANHRPNELSKRVSQSEWGFATKFITNIATTEEASNLVGLYLKDMKNMNFWWEKDEGEIS